MPLPSRRDPRIPFDFATALGRGLFDKARYYSRVESTSRGDIWMVSSPKRTFYVRAWRYEMAELGLQER